MKSSSSGVLAALALAAPLTLFGAVVLAGAVLRETPLFWRSAGGYSVELRELVLEGFYPAFVIYFFWLLFGSLTVCRMLRRLNRAGIVLLLACVGNWLLLAVITTVVLWNNLENLLEGLPVHYHAS